MATRKAVSSEGRVSAHVLIVEARFYEGIAEALAEGALAVLARRGASAERRAVPGALEIPVAVAMAAATGRYDGFIALGCVIRGETSHYDIVAGESARALMDLATHQRLAIGNGILTVETEAQAWARARAAELDKGGGAAAACLDMIAFRRWSEGRL